MDPIRLIDQPELTDRERAALQAGQQQPVVYDVSQGAERLGKALSQAGASATATPSSVAAKLGIKLLFTAALTSLAFIAAMQLTTPHEIQSGATSAPVRPVVSAPPVPAPAAQPAPAHAEPPAPVAAPAGEREPAAVRVARKSDARDSRRATSATQAAPAVAAQEAPALEVIEATQQTVEPERAAKAEPQRPREAEPEPAPVPSAAMLEMKAIARAKRALSEREPDKALAILADAARDFPRGYFIEERRALRVLALADEGESEQARREAASFVRDYPSGAFTTRVKAAAER